MSTTRSPSQRNADWPSGISGEALLIGSASEGSLRRKAEAEVERVRDLMANAHAKSLVDMQRVTDASRAEHQAEIAKLKQTHESEQAEMQGESWLWQADDIITSWAASELLGNGSPAGSLLPWATSAREPSVLA